MLLSGLFWEGPPHALIREIRPGTLFLITGPALLTEIEDVLLRPKFQRILSRAQTTPERILGELRGLAEIVDAPPMPTPVSRDPDDDAVLAVAVASQADLIVSGDADLLSIGAHAGIPIIDAAAAIARIAK